MIKMKLVVSDFWKFSQENIVEWMREDEQQEIADLIRNHGQETSLMIKTMFIARNWRIPNVCAPLKNYWMHFEEQEGDTSAILMTLIQLQKLLNHKPNKPKTINNFFKRAISLAFFIKAFKGFIKILLLKIC